MVNFVVCFCCLEIVVLLEQQHSKIYCCCSSLMGAVKSSKNCLVGEKCFFVFNKACFGIVFWFGACSVCRLWSK